MNGKLCFAAFDNDGNEWMVRRETQNTISVWVLYMAGELVSRHATPREAHTEYSKYVPARKPGDDLESSMSR